MNKCVLSGRTTRDADIRTSEKTIIARFNLAVDRRFKRDETDFISCVAFGKTAEFIEKYIPKGTKIMVEGRIQTGSYTTQTGEKRYTTDIIVENVEFAESKKAENPADGFQNIADEVPPFPESLPY